MNSEKNEEYKKFLDGFVDYVEYNEKIPIIIGLIHILYSLPGCGSGGCCHVVIDDNNIDDTSLLFVINYCKNPKNADRIDKELSITICELLIQLSFEQRCVLFYMFERGYLDHIDYNIFDEMTWNHFIEFETDKNVGDIIKYFTYD